MAKLFRSNRSQAVRIPKDLEFPRGVTDVDVVPQGDDLLLVAKRKPDWKTFFEQGPFMSDDFMIDRDQPEGQERDPH